LSWGCLRGKLPDMRPHGFGQRSTVRRRKFARIWPALAVLVAAVAAVPATSADAAERLATSTGTTVQTTYQNPVSRTFADTYADPSVIRGADGWWWAYGTTDPLREGESTRHVIPMAKSRNLVDWTYVGDAFTEATLPSWADTSRGAALWAPDVEFVDGRYRMYYVVTETTVTGEPNDNAIGMATSSSPGGPWTDSGAPVVGPRRGGGGEPGNFLWTFDPEVVTDPADGSEHIFYGSYYGGIWHARLNAAGTQAESGAVQVAIDNKFEGAYVTRRGGYWYLFASTANCCAGPTTGYSVQVGRSTSLTGPFLDKEGVPLTASRAGGTPTLYQNGNAWIGAGHNTLATDDAGQDWILYHAIDRADPYLTGTAGINERPMLIDRLDWVNGWPQVRGGCGPSASPQPGPTVSAPAAASSTVSATATTDCPTDFTLGTLDRRNSDEFNSAVLQPDWQRVRNPNVTFSGATLNWATERTDLVGTGNDASLLLRKPSTDEWTVETKVTIDLGTDAIRNYQQAGLIAYVDDNLFTRLSHVAIWNTRQTEFGKEMPYAGGLSYGGTIVGPPAETTWLRITARVDPATKEIRLTPFTSRDGSSWTRGGTWTLPPKSDIRVGLLSHGAGGSDASPATARFDYFRLYTR
jgi:arabinan endo-1,5-alpha-L-arabinosidase